MSFDFKATYQPDSGKVSKARSYGNWLLSDEAVALGYRTAFGGAVVSPLSEPIMDAAGTVTDVRPFRIPTEGAHFSMATADGQLTPAPTDAVGPVGQYELGAVTVLRVASNIGKQNDRNSTKVTIINGHDSDELDPSDPRTCLDSLAAEANVVLAENPQWAARSFYDSSSEYKSWLKTGAKETPTLAGMCFEHQGLKITPDQPRPVVYMMAKTAVDGLKPIIFNEDPSYQYPETEDEYAALASREEQAKRFPTCPDPCQPWQQGGHPGSPAFRFQPGQDGAVKVYHVTQTDQPYPLSVDQHAHYWLPANRMFYVPKFEETFNLIMRYADDPDWAAFLSACARRVPRLAPLVGPERTVVAAAAVPAGAPQAPSAAPATVMAPAPAPAAPAAPMAPPAPAAPAPMAPPAPAAAAPAAAPAAPPAPAAPAPTAPAAPAPVAPTAPAAPAPATGAGIPPAAVSPVPQQGVPADSPNDATALSAAVKARLDAIKG